MPSALGIRYAGNRLQDVAAKTSRGAEDSHKERLQKQRKERVFKRVEKMLGTEEEIRRKARESGLFLCNEICPETGRYCRADFLESNRLVAHTAKGKHDFPKGINVRDKMLLSASRPNGVLAVGSRPDRLSTKMHQTIEESPEGARGADHAVSFRRFNRREGYEKYQKPPMKSRIAHQYLY